MIAALPLEEAVAHIAQVLHEAALNKIIWVVCEISGVCNL